MGSHYAFINGKLTPVVILHRYQPDNGRRRYNSYSNIQDYSTGYEPYSSHFTYTLPSDGYTGPALSNYGSGLATYDVMSRYSRGLDYSQTYDTPTASYSTGTGSGDVGMSGRYGGSSSVSGHDSLGGGMYSTNSYRYDPNSPNYEVTSSYPSRVQGYDVTGRTSGMTDQSSTTSRYMQGNPNMTRTHDTRREAHISHRDPRGETHADRKKEDNRSTEKQEKHSYHRNRGPSGVEKDEEMSLYKASYRRYREVHDDGQGHDVESNVSPDSSLGQNRDSRDIIAEIKNKYRPRKQADEKQTSRETSQTVSSSLNGRGKSSRTESSSSALSSHGRSERLNSDEKSSQSDDKDSDTMPVWRKRRLEREQRRKEFLSMSESRSRERKKSEEKEKVEQDVERLNRLGIQQSDSSTRLDKSESRPYSERISKQSESRLNPSSSQSESRTHYSESKTDNRSSHNIRDQIESESRLQSRESRSQQSERRPNVAHSRLKHSESSGKSDQHVQTQTDNQSESGQGTTIKPRAISAEAMKNILMQRDSPLLRTRYAEAKRKKELERDSGREESDSSLEMKSREFYSLPTASTMVESKPVKRAESLSSMSKTEKLNKPVKRTESLYTSPLKSEQETTRDQPSRSENVSERSNVSDNKRRSWSSSERILAGNLVDNKVSDSTTARDLKSSDTGRSRDRFSPLTRYLQGKKSSVEQTNSDSESKSIPTELHKPVFSKPVDSPSSASRSSECLKAKVSSVDANKHFREDDALDTTKYLDSLKTKHLESKAGSSESSDVEKPRDYLQSAKSRYFESVRQLETEKPKVKVFDSPSKVSEKPIDNVQPENKDSVRMIRSVSATPQMGKSYTAADDSTNPRPLSTGSIRDSVRSEKPDRIKTKMLDSVKQSDSENLQQNITKKVSVDTPKVQTPEYKVLRQPQQYTRSKTENQTLEERPDKKVTGTDTEYGQSRKMRHYGKSKAVTTDVASLLVKTEEKEKDTVKSKEESDAGSMAGLTRLERIALYKEERRRQLAFIANRFGDLDSSDKEKSVDVVPSLFHASSRGNSVEREESSSLARSKSMKESPKPKPVSLVSRSQSLREEVDIPKPSEGQGQETDSSSNECKISLAAKFAHFRNRFEEGNVSQIEMEDSFSSKVQKDETNKELSSLEKARQTCLYAESVSNKSENTDMEQDKKDVGITNLDNKPQKRRRQLPSIPVVLGEKTDKLTDEETKTFEMKFESLQRRFSSSDNPPPSPGVKIEADTKKRSSSIDVVKPPSPVPVVRNIAAEIASRRRSSSELPTQTVIPAVQPVIKTITKSSSLDKAHEQPPLKITDGESSKIPTASQVAESKKNRYQRATVKNVQEMLGTERKDIPTSQSKEALHTDQIKDVTSTEINSLRKLQSSVETKNTSVSDITSTKDSRVTPEVTSEIIMPVKQSLQEMKPKIIEDSNKSQTYQESTSKENKKDFKMEFKPGISIEKDTFDSNIKTPVSMSVPPNTVSVEPLSMLSSQQSVAKSKQDTTLSSSVMQTSKGITSSLDTMKLQTGSTVTAPKVTTVSKETGKELTSKSTPLSEPKKSVSKMALVTETKKEIKSVAKEQTVKDEKVSKPTSKTALVSEAKKQVTSVAKEQTVKDEKVSKPTMKTALVSEAKKQVTSADKEQTAKDEKVAKPTAKIEKVSTSSVSKIQSKKDEGVKSVTKDTISSAGKVRKSEEKKDGSKKEQKVLVKRRPSDKRQRVRETSKSVEVKEAEKKLPIAAMAKTELSRESPKSGEEMETKKVSATADPKSLVSIVQVEKKVQAEDTQIGVKKTGASKLSETSAKKKMEERRSRSKEKEQPKGSIVEVKTKLSKEIIEKSTFEPIQTAAAKKGEPVIETPVKEKPKTKRQFKKLDKAGIKRSKSVSDKDRKPPRKQLPLGDTIFSKADMLRILTKSPEANLDDLLKQNADYLTDPELVPTSPKEWLEEAIVKTKSGHKETPKQKRTLKKKLLPRSKSDTSQLMEIARSKRESSENSETKQEKEGQTTQKNPTETRERSGTYTISVESEGDKKEQPSAGTKQSESEIYQTRTLPNTTDNVLGTQSVDTVQTKAVLKPEFGQFGFDSKDLPVTKPHGVDLTQIPVSVHEASPDRFISEEAFDPRMHFSAIDESKMDSEKDSLRVTTTDSDSVADSSGGVRGDGSERRRRKDKSSARKSPLNFSPTPDVSRNGVDSTEIREGKSGILSATSLQDDTVSTGQTKAPGVSAIQPLQKSLRHEHLTSPNLLNHDDSSQHASGRSGSVLEKLLPSKFSLPSKVSSAISKFSGDGEKSRESSVKKVEEKTPRKIARRQDFSTLLQKFSSSDQSSSETEQQQSPRRRFSLKRQEAYSVSSDESSSEHIRRTPERTQSLRMHKSPTPEDRTELKLIQRSGSFKSDFMRRRYSPEPTNRVPLPEDHDKKKPKEEQTDKPSPELASVLHRQKGLVTRHQIDGEQAERDRITDKTVEKEYNRPSAAEVSQTIADQQLVNVLQSRRKETDLSNITEKEEKITRTEPVSQQEFTSSESSVVSATEGPKHISHLPESHRSFPETSHTEKKMTSVPASRSLDSKYKSAKDPTSDGSVKSEPFSSEKVAKDTKLDISAIDASLAVLNQVTADMEDKDDKKDRDVDKNITDSLSKVHVDSPSEVEEFIKTVQKSSHFKEPRVTARNKEGSPVQEVTARVVAKISPDRETLQKTKESSPVRVSSKLSPFFDRAGSPGTNRLSPSPPSLGLKRAQSYGRAEGADHKPRGILKRTPSLKHSGVIVDPELANILQMRRQRQGDEEEEVEESGPLTAKEDIKQTIKKELASKSVENGKADEENSQKSMAERIYQMQTKLEDTSKSCPITPRNRSGTTTPKFTLKNRSESLTPKAQFSFDESLVQPQVTGEQLIQKLSNLANKGKSVSQKRKQFQQTSRHDFRRHTQPITLEELEEADSLDSVKAFRAEVLRKASTNIFESCNKKDKKPQGLKPVEYPQPYHRVKLKRSRKDRHKTLPITAAELGAIPEGQYFESPFSSKKDFTGTRDSKTDSGILSGSDAESYIDSQMSDSLRSLSLEMDMNEDDPARLSVSAKASMFTKQIEEKGKVEKPKVSASGAKRYIDRKKRERSRTQPVTEDEVKTAAEIADGTEEKEGDNSEKKEEKEKLDEKPAKVQTEEKTDSDDELSRRSLAEKVKLFSSLKETKKPAGNAPVVRKRNRKVASRFQTQPVTIEEVEKAAEFRISPLAMSLVKPPDPELLKTLPLSAQRELMAQHAEACLSQPSSRSSSRHGSMKDLSTTRNGSMKDLSTSRNGSTKDLSTSRNGSTKDLSTSRNGSMKDLSSTRSGSSKDLSGSNTGSAVDLSESSSKGILRKGEMGKDSSSFKGILKSDQLRSPEREVKGILKSESGNHDVPEPKGILKSEELSDSEPSRSILKHHETDRVTSPGLQDSDQKGILKHQEIEGKEAFTDKDIDHKGILKLSDATEDVKSKSEDVKGVFKKESSLERVKSPEPRGILKKESSFEMKKTEPEKSVLKKSPSKESALLGELKSILKKESSEEEVEPKEEVKPAVTEGVKDTVNQEAVEGGGTDDEILSPDSSAVRRRGRDKKQSDRYLTQPAEVSTPEKSPETPRKFKYTSRHKTQPITPEEKRAAEASQDVTDPDDMGSTSSIKDRLSALKKSGEEDWRRRITKQLEEEGIGSPVNVKMREKLSTTPARPSSIADRLTQLGSAQEGWRGRVEETDAKRFTVAHKIAGQVEESPLVSKLKRRAKKESDSESGSEVTSPSTPTKEWPKIPIPTTLLSGPPVVKPDMEICGEAEEEKEGPVTVSVPSLDDDILEAFFVKTSHDIELAPVDVKIDDFNEIFIDANDILETTRRIRPKRKHTARSKNPLKTMSMTLEVKAEYEEVKFGYAEQELKRQKTAALSRDAGFAQEALAGLASKENFAKVSLRKVADTPTNSSSRLEPYKDLMLLHVKGRRRVQTRLVEPCAKSINSGDCYLLVAPDKVITWNGEYCNVIEKAKAADIASMILQKKDMGCKNASGVGVVEERRQHLGTGKQFWGALGGLETVACGGPTEEDELYENHIVETNMVYHLVENTLTPYQDFWGTTPKYSMLKKDEVIVFDFGTEFYIWQGKAVKPEQRKLGLKLARQLWDKGYDYSSCDINPFCPLTTEEMGGLPMKSATRPSWALFGKVNQNMETILFREKFADWPDNSRLIQVKGQTEMTGSKSDLSELKAYDAKLLIPVNTAPVSLVLEGSHVGRGLNWSEDMEGFIREQDIVTLGVTVWHVLEYEHFKVPETSFGQFHDGDTYVVRWQYMITNKGAKDLKGSQSRRSLVGRERCAYFFWQGKGSTINEKGASALMTVELDEERGPQVRVDEGKEMPCFLNLFAGKMIIHIGKREEESTNTQGPWRCYCVRHDYSNEMCLMEVPTDTHCLRSRSSLLFLNVYSGQLCIWHGCKSPEHVRLLAKSAADSLKEKCPLEVGLDEKASIEITEMKEGSEKAEFWRMMGVQSDDRSSHYHSLLTDTLPYNHTVRLFHMTSVSGVFVVQEVMNPSRVPDLASPFPVLQSDLYKASQPALFLVDNDHCVYLWHGWWPEGDEEIENVQTGSAKARFNTDRKCAIDTVLQYCQERNADNPPKAFAVYGGLEPLQFKNLFPYWEEDEVAKEINLRDGKTEREMTPVEAILEKVTQTRYTFTQLQERPLPEGVDPLKLESYLEDEEFEEILEMSKEDFYLLPQWQQHKLKQQVDLF